MEKEPETVVIPKEEAVFWLDSEGFWRNAGGRFRKKKIIDYFHRSIDRDENGYFLMQDKGGTWEKIYFPYEDTALFVFDIHADGDSGGDIALTLNTGRRISLAPEKLYIYCDKLYMISGEDRIKFAERAMIKISKWIQQDEEGRLWLKIGDGKYLLEE